MAFQGHAQLEGKSEKEATGQLQELLKLRVKKEAAGQLQEFLKLRVRKKGMVNFKDF